MLQTTLNSEPTEDNHASTEFFVNYLPATIETDVFCD